MYFFLRIKYHTDTFFIGTRALVYIGVQKKFFSHMTLQYNPCIPSLFPPLFPHYFPPLFPLLCSSLFQPQMSPIHLCLSTITRAEGNISVPPIHPLLATELPEWHLGRTQSSKAGFTLRSWNMQGSWDSSILISIFWMYVCWRLPFKETAGLEQEDNYTI